jgi:hypothetical protein
MVKVGKKIKNKNLTSNIQEEKENKKKYHRISFIFMFSPYLINP